MSPGTISYPFNTITSSFHSKGPEWIKNLLNNDDDSWFSKESEKELLKYLFEAIKLYKKEDRVLNISNYYINTVGKINGSFQVV